MPKVKKAILTIAAILITLLTIFNTVAVLYTAFTLKSFLESDFYTFFPGMTPSTHFYKIDDVGYISYDVCFPNIEKIESGEELNGYSWSELMDELMAAAGEAESDSDNTGD